MLRNEHRRKWVGKAWDPWPLSLSESISGWWLQLVVDTSSHIDILHEFPNISNINPTSQVIRGLDEVPSNHWRVHSSRASAISWRQFNPKCRTAVAEGKPFRWCLNFSGSVVLYGFVSGCGWVVNSYRSLNLSFICMEIQTGPWNEMEEAPCDIKSRLPTVKVWFFLNGCFYCCNIWCKKCIYGVDLWNSQYISAVAICFSNSVVLHLSAELSKKTSLATPFLLVSPTFFSVSMYYIIQISDLLLPHHTCFANPVTVHSLNTGLKSSMCLKKHGCHMIS